MSDKTKSNQRGMEIIRAASEVFSLYGYGKTSLDDIASALNITRSALYYYHRNKDDLFLAVIDNWLHDYRLELEKAIAGEMTTEHRLEIFCRCYLDYRLKFFKINKFNDDDYPVPFDLLKRIKSRSISLQVSIITGILERDDALKDIESAVHYAGLLFHSIRGFLANMLSEERDTLERKIIEMCGIFLRGLHVRICETSQRDKKKTIA